VRRRLLTSTLVVAIVAVVLLGVPLGYVGARLVRDEARQRLIDAAQRISAEVGDLVESHQVLDQARLAKLAPAARRVVVTLPDGVKVATGAVPDRQLAATEAIADGGDVVVAMDRNVVDQRILRGWLLIGGLVAVSTGVAIGLAFAQARRLGLPLDALALDARRLGSGDTRPSGRRYGIPEIDRVAEVLDSSAERLGELIRREREFATDASHELRTPLTALSIRLEEIGMSTDLDEIREESEAALAQVERLASVVNTLLARARDRRVGNVTTIDVAELLQAQVREIEPAFRRSGRQVVVEARPGLVVAGTSGGLAQALAALLDNALVHGSGTVTVRARPAADHVVVEVSDEGRGVAPGLVRHVFERSVSGGSGTGLGLALARALIEADGGRLELVHARPPVFAAFLPVAPAPDDAGATEEPVPPQRVAG
jgi:signal transduction histidine kinase